ncbi:MAG: FAD-binding oxidoreductase [Deinococcus sp.]|nr:FAD-binding oxidoreductase [Deinococcus sp.]
MAVATTSQLAQRLGAIVSARHTLADEAARPYAIDGLVPQAVAFPGSVGELCELLRLAQQDKLAVCPWGGGTEISFGNLPERLDLVIALPRLNQLLDHQPEDLIATAQAGMTLHTFQAHLGVHNQFLPLDPPCPERATLGGMAAASSSGLLRLRYGLPRDLIIRMVVAGAGGTLSASGAKVVKNVAGFDMAKLYVGSLGALGIITEMTFRVRPRPLARRSALARFSQLEAARSMALAVIHSELLPEALEILSPRTLGNEAWGVLALFGGGPEIVAAHAKRFIDRAGAAGAQAAEEVSAGELLLEQARRPDGGVAAVLAQASVPLTGVAPVLAVAEQLGAQQSCTIWSAAHFGSGAVLVAADGPEPALGQLLLALRQSAVGQGGSLVLRRAPEGVKRQVDVWGEVTGGLTVMRRLKENFDPQRILSPGRLAGGL